MVGVGWLLLAAAPWYLPVRRRQQRKKSAQTSVPPAEDVAETLVELSARLQAGQGVQAALAGVLDPLIHQPSPPPWARYVRAKVAGSRLEVPQPQDLPPGSDQAVAAISAAATLVREYGMEMASVLQASVRGIVATQQAQTDRDAALAGPRTTARILQWLPLAALLGATALGADPLSTLLGTLWGNAALVLGVGFMVAGRIWLQRLIKLAEAGKLASKR